MRAGGRAICYLVLILALGSSSAKTDFTVSPVALGYPSLLSPTSITHHPSGLWVVSDTGNDRIVLLNEDLTLNSTFSGVLTRPRGLTVDPDGKIWISDGGNDRIVVIDTDLSIVEIFGSSGEGPGQFNLPWGIASYNGRIAIADALNRRVQILGPDLDVQAIFGSWGTQPGDFDGPLDLAFDSRGRLFVVDTYLEAEGYMRRIQVFNADFTFNHTIWDIQSRLRFTRPVGIGISSDDVVAVADCMANRIYFFDSQGTHLGGVSGIDGQPGLKSPYDVAFAPQPSGDLLLGIVEREPGRVRVIRFSMPEVSRPLLVLMLACLAWLPGARGVKGEHHKGPK